MSAVGAGCMTLSLTRTSATTLPMNFDLHERSGPCSSTTPGIMSSLCTCPPTAIRSSGNPDRRDDGYLYDSHQLAQTPRIHSVRHCRHRDLSVRQCAFSKLTCSIASGIAPRQASRNSDSLQSGTIRDICAWSGLCLFHLFHVLRLLLTVPPNPRSLPLIPH